MQIIERRQIPEKHLPGRIIQKAVGKDSFSSSNRISMGFALYSERSGVMEPHQHAEEVVYIVDAHHGWLRYGQEKDRLGEHIPLQAGMTLHIPPQEWHMFGYDPGGFVDIIFIYGQVENIRPEEMAANR